MVVNFNEVFKRTEILEEGDISVWDKISYCMDYSMTEDTDLGIEAYKDHIGFAVFTVSDPLSKIEGIGLVSQNGMFISSFDEVQQKIELISEGLGESLDAFLYDLWGKAVGIKELIYLGGLTFQILDWLLILQSSLLNIVKTRRRLVLRKFPRPNSKPSVQKSKKNKRKRSRKLQVEYFQIEYLKIPKADDLPQWFKKDPKPSTPRSKSIDPRFMSSHYRRIWVTDSYIEKKRHSRRTNFGCR